MKVQSLLLTVLIGAASMNSIYADVHDKATDQYFTTITIANEALSALAIKKIADLSCFDLTLGHLKDPDASLCHQLETTQGKKITIQETPEFIDLTTDFISPTTKHKYSFKTSCFFNAPDQENIKDLIVKDSYTTCLKIDEAGRNLACLSLFDLYDPKVREMFSAAYKEKKCPSDVVQDLINALNSKNK